MSGRRPRLVIKPNIRPGAGAAKSTPVSKPKSTSETVGSSKPQPAPITLVEKVISSKDENSKDKEEKSKVSVPLPEQEGVSSIEVTTRNLNDNDQPEKIPQPQIELQSPSELSILEAHEREIDLTKNVAVPCAIIGSFKTPKASKAPQQQASSGIRETSLTVEKSANGAPVLSKPVNEKTVVVKRQDQSSEADESDASVASSLEPDREQQAEVEETPGKKPRQHRSRKPKLEALPSRDKSPDRQKMKMSDLLLWNPERNFLPTKPKKKRNLKDENRPTSPDEREKAEAKAKEMEKTENAALPAPQVMIGPDGNVVLNTESLLISTPEKESQGRSKIIVEEDDEDRYLNTNSYRKYHKKKLWSEEETDKFFLGLSMCGTDFSLLTKLLTNRSRRELKNKFIREEKHNRSMVDKALSSMRQYDPSAFVEKSPPPPKPKVKKQPKETKPAKITKALETSKKEPKVPAFKEPHASKKKAKKRKLPESSEDEEDDWGPEYDEIDEEEEMAARIPAYKKRSQQNAEDQDGDEIGHANRASSSILSGPVRSGPATAVTEPEPSSSAAVRRDATVPQVSKPKGIQAIPGTTQVQIEVSGVQTPVQGMLIPADMVPALAPQLGLGEGVLGGRVQVLLVHEESAEGSLVHVYIIPEDDSTTGSNSTSLRPVVGTPTAPWTGPLSATATSGAVRTGLVSSGQGNTQPSVQNQVSRNPEMVQSGARSSSSHQPSPQGGYTVTVRASPCSVQSQFPPTPPVPLGAQLQRQLSSPFPPVPTAGLKSQSPFPPYGASARSPSPYLQTVDSKSPAPFPPTARSSSSSPFPPFTSGNPSPVGFHPQSPFPPFQTGKKNSPSPRTENSVSASTLPCDGTLFPMSPPSLQSHTPLGRMPRPKPHVEQSLVRDIYSESKEVSPATEQNGSLSSSSLANIKTGALKNEVTLTGSNKDDPTSAIMSHSNSANFSDNFTMQNKSTLPSPSAAMAISGQSLETNTIITRVSEESTHVLTGYERNLSTVLSQAQEIISELEVGKNTGEDQDFAAVDKVEVNRNWQQQNK